MKSNKKSKEFIALCESYGVDADNVPEITSIEDAFKAIGEDPLNLPDVSKVLKKHQQALINNYQAWIIVEAFNEGWTADFTNDEPKYSVWFYAYKDSDHSSGVGFSSYDCGHWRTLTAVGSRLCFRNKDIGIFVTKHFCPLFRGFYLIE